MGLAQYFRKFIQGFSTLTAPLTSLFRKGATWKWAEPQHAAFMGLKHALTSAPVLKLPDPGLEISVVSDASSVGVGAVLMQSDLPVALEFAAFERWHNDQQAILAEVQHKQTLCGSGKCTSCHCDNAASRATTSLQHIVPLQVSITTWPRAAGNTASKCGLRGQEADRH